MNPIEWPQRASASTPRAQRVGAAQDLVNRRAVQQIRGRRAARPLQSELRIARLALHPNQRTGLALFAIGPELSLLFGLSANRKASERGIEIAERAQSAHLSLAGTIQPHFDVKNVLESTEDGAAVAALQHEGELTAKVFEISSIRSNCR